MVRNIIKLSSYLAFTASMLEVPIFASDYPRVFKYAALGSTIAHEISHAFDSSGAQYDKDGNFVEWWSDASKSTFDCKVQCFVEQYNQYKVYEAGNETIWVNGEVGKTENIADSHGVQFAYQAYENSKTLDDVNLQLLGLEGYTDRQLFFLAHASVWCGAERPSHYKRIVDSDTHTTDKVRVIGSLSNSKEFSAAFDCPDNARMNPKRKCTIWGKDDVI